jgi:hypothetical protein
VSPEQQDRLGIRQAALAATVKGKQTALSLHVVEDRPAVVNDGVVHPARSSDQTEGMDPAHSPRGVHNAASDLDVGLVSHGE